MTYLSQRGNRTINQTAISTSPSNVANTIVTDITGKATLSGFTVSAAIDLGGGKTAYTIDVPVVYDIASDAPKYYILKNDQATYSEVEVGCYDLDETNTTFALAYAAGVKTSKSLYLFPSTAASQFKNFTSVQMYYSMDAVDGYLAVFFGYTSVTSYPISPTTYYNFGSSQSKVWIGSFLAPFDRYRDDLVTDDMCRYGHMDQGGALQVPWVKKLPTGRWLAADKKIVSYCPVNVCGFTDTSGNQYNSSAYYGTSSWFGVVFGKVYPLPINTYEPTQLSYVLSGALKYVFISVATRGSGFSADQTTFGGNNYINLVSTHGSTANINGTLTFQNNPVLMIPLGYQNTNLAALS